MMRDYYNNNKNYNNMHIHILNNTISNRTVITLSPIIIIPITSLFVLSNVYSFVYCTSTHAQRRNQKQATENLALKRICKTKKQKLGHTLSPASNTQLLFPPFYSSSQIVYMDNEGQCGLAC